MVRKIPTSLLVRYLTSRNPALRARADAILDRHGSNAGDPLFAAAEFVSRRYEIRYAVAGLAATIVGVSLFFAGLTIFAGRDTTHFWYPAAITLLLRAIWDITADQLSRRERLKVIALELARRNDLRAIGPLLEAWQPLSFWGRPRHDDDVENELTRLLPLFLRQRSMDLRSYKRRHLRNKAGRLFSYRRLRRHVAPRVAFTDSRADAVVTVLQLLARSKSDHDRALLERISRLTTSAPNDIFIRDAAAVCLTRNTAAPTRATAEMAEAAPPARSGANRADEQPLVRVTRGYRS